MGIEITEKFIERNLLEESSETLQKSISPISNRLTKSIKVHHEVN